MAILGVSLTVGTTNLVDAAASEHAVALLAAGASLFLVMLAETSRVPIDNQETHLELTMIHEAMVLEYSGRSLALIELALYLKQLIFFSSIACLLCVNIYWRAVVSVPRSRSRSRWSNCRWRRCGLFRVVDYIAFAGILSMIASSRGCLNYDQSGTPYHARYLAGRVRDGLRRSG